MEIVDEDDTDEDEEEVEEETAWVRKPDDRMSHAEWHELFISLGAHIGAQRDYYYDLSDPYEDPPDPAFGSLSDDLADIYRDLKSGLANWHRGELDDALWEWRFHFTAHWGEHAATALRALHELDSNSRYGLEFPRTTGTREDSGSNETPTQA